MDKKTKTVFTIIIGILVLITVVGFVYGMQNKKQTDAIYASYDNNILSTVDSAVKVCQSVFKSVGATDEENDNLNDYITNINNSKSPVLKAYIADCMLTYAGDLVTIKEQNYAIGLGGKSANFTGLQEKLLSIGTKLSAARNYANNNNNNSTVTDTTNTSKEENQK